MAHEIGAGPLPLADQTQEGAPGASYLDILATDFQRILNKELGDAWKSVARMEGGAVVSAFPRIPDDDLRIDKDLPGLFVFVPRGQPGVQSRETPSRIIRRFQIHMRWIAPPAQSKDLVRRDQFWNALDEVVQLYTLDPYISIDRTATSWGRHIRDKSGLYELETPTCEFTEFTLGTGGKPLPGCEWVFPAATLITPNHQTQGPVSPACAQNTYLGGDDLDLVLFTSDLS